MRFFVLLWLWGTALSGSAQKLGHSLLRFTYRYTGTTNLDQPEKKTYATFYLDTDGTQAFFYDPVRRAGDSLLYLDKAAGLSDMELLAGIGKYNRGAGFQAQTNIAMRRMTVWDDIGQYFRYEERLPLQQWQVHTDTMRLQGLLCHKATTTFRGRKFTAWYAPDIPVAVGPWKFHGLPGALLLVSDAAGHYRFECSSVVPLLRKDLPASFVTHARSTNFISFARLRRQKAEDPHGFLQSMAPGVTFTPASGSISGILKGTNRFNPLELEEN